MQKPDTNLQKTMSAAYTLLGSLLCSGAIGYYLSHKYETIIWLILFLILGTIVGMYELYKQIK